MRSASCVLTLFLLAVLRIDLSDGQGLGCSYPDVALGAFSSASSGTSSFVVDGNDLTRWESAHADGEWLALDLGAKYTLCSVHIKWEAAHAAIAEIQVGSQGAAGLQYTTVATAKASSGGWSLTRIPKQQLPTTRYFRLLCITRGTSWGNSIFTLQLFGLAAPSPPGSPFIPPSPPSPPTPPFLPPQPTPPSPPLQPPPMPAGLFTFFSEALSWYAASGACKSRGQHLASIRNMNENGWAVTACENNCWIGYYREGGIQGFKWADDSGVGFQSWAIGEPNLGAGNGAAYLVTDNVWGNMQVGDWDDNPITNVRSYLCRHPPPTPGRPPYPPVSPSPSPSPSPPPSPLLPGSEYRPAVLFVVVVPGEVADFDNAAYKVCCVH